MPQEMFGPYRLEQLLGRGGMGEVHRAHDTVRGRTVALKRLLPGLSDDQVFRERFRRESQLVARLREGHVIPIHDFGEIDGRLYLDMRLVDGTDLHTILARSGPLSPQRAVRIVGQVAGALDAAHADGLVHRDVKPSNVLVTDGPDEDYAYLVDFGIVGVLDGGGRHLTVTGSPMGTVAYMAPERFEGGGDRRVDVYALGCVLHEMLTGTRPFTGNDMAQMWAHLHAAPPQASQLRPGVPPAMDAVIAAALTKDPAARIPSAGDLAARARAVLDGDPYPSRPATVIPGIEGPYRVPYTGPPGSAPVSGPSGHPYPGPPGGLPFTSPYGPSYSGPSGAAYPTPSGPVTGAARPSRWGASAVVAAVVGVLVVAAAAVGITYAVTRPTDDLGAPPTGTPTTSAAPTTSAQPTTSAPTTSAPPTGPSGGTSVYDLQVGQCLVEVAAEGLVSSVEVVDCGQPHVGEVQSLPQLPDGAFPGEEAVLQQSEQLCTGQAFQDYVGRPFVQSEIYVSWLSPSAETWAEGDREIVCILRNEDGSPITGSLRGANR